jgi:hypothetical protein
MLNPLAWPEDTIICGYRRVVRLTSEGTPFATWIKAMGRRLPDYMMDSVVFVYPSKESADLGEEKGATGFLIGVPSKAVSTKGHIYVVTNAHVIEHGGRVVRMNKYDGTTATFDLKGAWVPHPDGDDVAIAPLEDIVDHNLSSRILHSDVLLSEEEFTRQEVGIGDDAYMVGRFLGHEHRETNKPVIQQGKIAAPLTRLTNPETKHEQLSILVELRSMGGYSGSVVILDPPGRILGINYCHLPVRSPVKFLETEETETETDYFVDMPSGMAAVVPAWKIIEMLGMDQFKRQRYEEGRRMLKRESTKRTKPSLDDAVPKRRNRDVLIPPLNRKKFFEALEKATKRDDK